MNFSFLIISFIYWKKIQIYEVLISIHVFDVKTEQAVKEITNSQHCHSIPKYKESFKEKFLRELICLSRLKHNTNLVGNPTVLTNWKTNHKNLKNKLFYQLVGFSAKFISTYNQIEYLEKRFQKELRKTGYYKEIK